MNDVMTTTKPTAPSATTPGMQGRRQAHRAGVALCRGRRPAVEADALRGDRDEGARRGPGDRAPHRAVPLATWRRADAARACRDRKQTFVLEGSLEDEEGEVTAGNYVWRPKGNRHCARSPNGALVLSMFLKPNIFLTDDKEGVQLRVDAKRHCEERLARRGNLPPHVPKTAGDCFARDDDGRNHAQIEKFYLELLDAAVADIPDNVTVGFAASPWSASRLISRVRSRSRVPKASPASPMAYAVAQPCPKTRRPWNG